MGLFSADTPPTYAMKSSDDLNNLSLDDIIAEYNNITSFIKEYAASNEGSLAPRVYYTYQDTVQQIASQKGAVFTYISQGLGGYNLASRPTSATALDVGLPPAPAPAPAPAPPAAPNAAPSSPQPVIVNASGTSTTVGTSAATSAALATPTTPPSALPTQAHLDTMAASAQHPVVQAVAKTLNSVASLPSEIGGAVSDALGGLGALVQPAKTASQTQAHLDNINRAGSARIDDAVCRANPSWTNDPNYSNLVGKYVGTAQGTHDSTLGSIADSIGGMLDMLGNLASDVLGGLMKAISGITGAIAEALGAIGGVVGGLLKTVIGGFGNAIGGVLGGLGSVFGGHASNITSGCSTVSAAVTAESGALSSALTGAVSGPVVVLPTNASTWQAASQTSQLAANPPTPTLAADAAKAAAASASSTLGGGLLGAAIGAVVGKSASSALIGGVAGAIVGNLAANVANTTQPLTPIPSPYLTPTSGAS